MRELYCALVLMFVGALSCLLPAGATTLQAKATFVDGADRPASLRRQGVMPGSLHSKRSVAAAVLASKRDTLPEYRARDAVAVPTVRRSTVAPRPAEQGSTASRSGPTSASLQAVPRHRASDAMGGALDARGALIPGLPAALVASIVGLRTAAGAPGALGASNRAPISAAERAAQSLASPTPAGVGSDETGCLLLPVGHAVGVAMFRRFSDTVVVVDRPIESLPAGEGNWWQQHKPQMTRTAQSAVLRVPTPSGDGLRIERREDGLCLTGAREVSAIAPSIGFRSESDDVLFQLRQPGNTLTIVDPVTRSPLLIGTDNGSSGAVRPGRRSALFSIVETSAGVVVEPFSDRLSLHRSSDGFELATDGATSIHATPDFSNAPIASVDGLTRTLTVVAEPTDALVRQMRERELAAATAAPRGRSDRRLDLAEAMVALGLGSEARSVLAVAVADDPEAAASPRAALLDAITSILEKGRRGPDPFAAPAYPTTEEGKLWQALAWQPPAPVGSAIATIRRGMPLLLSYPARLRDAAAAQAARVSLASDDPDALRAIDLLPDSAAVRLARAIAAARLGRPETALAALAPLSRSRDLAVMANSLREVIRLKLAAGELTAAAAADLLDAHRLDWRLTAQEAPALVEEADDRLRVPDERAAFELWREALAVDPNVRDQVEPRRLAALNQLAKPEIAARVSASDYASIIAENVDIISADDSLLSRTGLILAEKFADLGLDDHEVATLERLVGTMPPGIARAAINTQIASVEVTQGAPAAATMALSRDDDGGLPQALVGRRALVRARALDGSGKSAEALALVATATDDEGLRLRAKLLMERQEWHAAIAPLTDLFHHLPVHGPLDAAQGAVVLQLVSASLRDGAEPPPIAEPEISSRLADPSERRSLTILMAPPMTSGGQAKAASTSGI